MENNTKIALVTGGSRGLGKDMAINLAKKGLDVILTYINSKEQAEEVVATIRQMGRKAEALQLDAGNVKSFGSFFEQVKQVLQKTFGADRFDYLVNNAGMGAHMPIAESTEEVFDSLVNVHLKGVYFLTQHSLPLMNDGGGVVNISSGLTRMTFLGAAAYASMKTAVETFTRYLAQELGSRGIRANVVAPGAIATDFGGGRVRDNEQLNKHIASVTALGRVGLAEDIGPVVAFLCTDDAKWVNAQRIEVSGGQGM